LAVFSKIDNQALILFIGLPGESFSRQHVALSFAGWMDAKQPDQSGADHVRIILLLVLTFWVPKKTIIWHEDRRRFAEGMWQAHAEAGAAKTRP